MLKQMFLQFLSEPGLTINWFYRGLETGVYVFSIDNIKLFVTLDSPFEYSVEKLFLLVSKDILHVKKITFRIVQDS